MTYAEKLRDPRWQKKRLEVFNRDNWQCCHCGNGSRTLHVHHIKYRGYIDPWEYGLEELQTLCAPCHTSLKDLRDGTVILDEGGWSYDGKCPSCGSSNIREKGSYDACNDCGFRICF